MSALNLADSLPQNPLPDSASVSPATAYLASLRTEPSRKGMVTALNTAAFAICSTRDWRAVDWSRINAAVVDAIMAKVQGAPASRNKLLSALKGVARAAYRLNQITSDDYAKIKDIGGDKGSREVAGRDVAHGEIAALIRICTEDPSPAGYRDAALFAVANATGARRAELAALSTVELSEDGELLIFRVIGKGNKERKLFLHNGAAQAVRDWLAIRGNVLGPVFCVIKKGGLICPERALGQSSLDELLTKRLKQAGLQKTTWHDFRRTVAGNLLDAGEDVVTVAGLLGHSSVTTTQRYDRRGERAKIRAAGKLAVPYFRALSEK